MVCCRSKQVQTARRWLGAATSVSRRIASSRPHFHSSAAVSAALIGDSGIGGGCCIRLSKTWRMFGGATCWVICEGAMPVREATVWCMLARSSTEEEATKVHHR